MHRIDGGPALCDPAPYFGWPEAELSMLYGTMDTVPAEFERAYLAVRPLDDGWRDRLPLLHLRELLAHFGDGDGRPGAQARVVLDRYS